MNAKYLSDALMSGNCKLTNLWINNNNELISDTAKY